MHSGSILARARKGSCCHEGAVSRRVRHAGESVRLKLDMEAWSSRCRRARWQSYRDALVALLEMIGKTCRYYEKANISIRPRRHQARAECIGSGKPRLGAGRAQTGLWRSGGGRCSRDEGLPRLGLTTQYHNVLLRAGRIYPWRRKLADCCGPLPFRPPLTEKTSADAIRRRVQ